MESVGAVGIAYFLDSSDQERNELGDQWERRVLESLLELKDLYAPDLEVSQRALIMIIYEGRSIYYVHREGEGTQK